VENILIFRNIAYLPYYLSGTDEFAKVFLKILKKEAMHLCRKITLLPLTEILLNLLLSLGTLEICSWVRAIKELLGKT